VRSPSLRDIPGVAELLQYAEIQALTTEWGRLAVREVIREQQAELRERWRHGQDQIPDRHELSVELRHRLLQRGGRGPRPVFNLTGTVIHTNLGRAMLPEAAIRAMAEAGRHPVDLEYDLFAGHRGQRDRHIAQLLCDLTGAEAATIVNNNAAALMLVLNTLALDRQVPVSRGELIEIGGSFRLPEIMARAGCRLREVGTTNRTHDNDYRAACGPETGLLLKVHRSNFVVAGFTAEVAEQELAALAREHDIPFVVDLGSGALVDLARYGVPGEPTSMQTLGRGADLVTFSGDKLLGGPQAGLIVGREDLIRQLDANPMKRALRVDKLTLSALAEVLKIYSTPDRLAAELPVIRDLARSPAEILAQATQVAPVLATQLPDFDVETAKMSSQVGSGALPQRELPSAGLRLCASSPDTAEAHLGRLLHALRDLPRPVIGRVRDGSLWLDFRCLDDEDGFIAQLANLSFTAQ